MSPENLMKIESELTREGQQGSNPNFDVYQLPFKEKILEIKRIWLSSLNTSLLLLSLKFNNGKLNSIPSVGLVLEEDLIIDQDEIIFLRSLESKGIQNKLSYEEIIHLVKCKNREKEILEKFSVILHFL